MMMHVIRPLGAIVVAVVLLMAGGGWPASAGGGVDLTGSWDFNFEGDLGFLGHIDQDCTMELVQTGSDLTGTFDCPIADGDISGPVTQQSLGALLETDLNVDPEGFSSFVVEADGEVTPDGNRFSGDWYSPTYDTEGTFDGEREVPSYRKGDLNCTDFVDVLDALLSFLKAADLPFEQQEDCPSLDSGVGLTIADTDCSGGQEGTDGALLLGYVAGYVPQDLPQGCPDISAFVTE